MTKLLISNRKIRDSNYKPVKKLYFYHCGIRLFGYAFMLGWIILAESRPHYDISFYPGFIPILIFAIYSVGAHFVFSNREKIGVCLSLAYKTIRMICLGQCTYLAGNIIQMPDGTYDVIEFQDKLWTIQVCGIILIPILIIIMVYYSFLLVNGLLKDRTSFDKRHIFGYMWTVLSSFSIYLIFFFAFKFKERLFSASEASVTNLAAGLGVAGANLLTTVLGRRPLQYDT